MHGDARDPEARGRALLGESLQRAASRPGRAGTRPRTARRDRARRRAAGTADAPRGRPPVPARAARAGTAGSADPGGRGGAGEEIRSRVVGRPDVPLDGDSRPGGQTLPRRGPRAPLLRRTTAARFLVHHRRPAAPSRRGSQARPSRRRSKPAASRVPRATITTGSDPTASFTTPPCALDLPERIRLGPRASLDAVHDRVLGQARVEVGNVDPISLTIPHLPGVYQAPCPPRGLPGANTTSVSGWRALHSSQRVKTGGAVRASGRPGAPRARGPLKGEKSVRVSRSRGRSCRCRPRPPSAKALARRPRGGSRRRPCTARRGPPRARSCESVVHDVMVLEHPGVGARAPSTTTPRTCPRRACARPWPRADIRDGRGAAEVNAISRPRRRDGGFPALGPGRPRRRRARAPSRSRARARRACRVASGWAFEVPWRS